ncbi:MAG: radical SAM protein [Elusimicrobiota bacterium]
MKVLFVQNVGENLGVEYVSAVLKGLGHETFLAFDPAIGDNFRFRSEAVKSVFSYDEAIVRRVRQLAPDLICFSVYSDTYQWAKRLAGKLKKECASPILFGGHHATAAGEEIIKEENVDYVCVGEGEPAIPELMDRLARGGEDPAAPFSANIIFKHNGAPIFPLTVKFVEDLNALPLPDKGLFYREHPALVRDPYAVVTSRSCIFECSYCHNSYLSLIYGTSRHKARRRSPANVINELLRAKVEFNIKRVAFFDDLFIHDADWLKDFLAQYREKIGLPFFCTVHSRFLTPETVALLESSGCGSVNFGIQTISERVRIKVLNRFEETARIQRGVELLGRTRIFLYTNVIFGLPGETEDETLETVKFLNACRPDFADSNWLRYYPKTRITEFAAEASLLTPEQLSGIGAGAQSLPYSLGGHTKTQANARIRNLLCLVNFLPRRMVETIIVRRLYRCLPAFDLRGICALCNIVFQKYFRGKKFPYPHVSALELLKFNAKYVFRRVKDMTCA